MHEYSFDEKKKLARKINKLKTQEQFIAIHDIIIKHNEDHPITHNPTGYYLFFHNLTNQTYVEIDEYLKGIKPVVEKEPEYYRIIESIETSESETKPIRLTNKERQIIKNKNRVFVKNI